MVDPGDRPRARLHEATRNHAGRPRSGSCLTTPGDPSPSGRAPGRGRPLGAYPDSPSSFQKALRGRRRTGDARAATVRPPHRGSATLPGPPTPRPASLPLYRRVHAHARPPAPPPGAHCACAHAAAPTPSARALRPGRRTRALRRPARRHFRPSGRRRRRRVPEGTGVRKPGPRRGRRRLREPATHQVQLLPAILSVQLIKLPFDGGRHGGGRELARGSLRRQRGSGPARSGQRAAAAAHACSRPATPPRRHSRRESTWFVTSARRLRRAGRAAGESWSRRCPGGGGGPWRRQRQGSGESSRLSAWGFDFYFEPSLGQLNGLCPTFSSRKM